MYHLIIDTCVWIDLGRTLVEVCEKISDLVKRGKVRLILPQIIIDEWNRHKPEIIAGKEQSIRGKIKNARSISEYLDQEAAEEFRRILDDFQERKGEIENLALKGVEAIEYLFSHSSSVRLAVTEKAKLQAVDCALAKRAPFQSKNSMADALIIFCVTDYIIQENLANCIFVSSDTQDFGSKSNKAQIHQDLNELFERCGMRYFSNIGLAVNEVEEELVSSEGIKKVEEALRFRAIQEAVLENQRQWTESIRSMLVEVPAIGEAVLESQRRWTESIRSMLEMPAIGEAVLENQRQWTESTRSMLVEVPAMGEAVLESQRRWMESIRSVVEAALIPEVILQSHRQMLESITMVGASVIREASLERQRQIVKVIRSMGDSSRVVENTEVDKQTLSQLNQEESKREASDGEVDSTSDQE
jgi:hypothetical protein